MSYHNKSVKHNFKNIILAKKVTTKVKNKNLQRVLESMLRSLNNSVPSEWLLKIFEEVNNLI